MKTHAILLGTLVLLLGGCRTAVDRGAASVPVLVHAGPTEQQFQQRVAELERAGHPAPAAERKARSEFAKNAWRYDNSQSWAREQMEKDLAKLP